MSDFFSGQSFFSNFLISLEDQHQFARISGDVNPVHLDISFAKLHGYDRQLVYGGLLIAKLSHIFGTRAPGSHGICSSYSINFHNPLLIDMEANLTVTIANVSESTNSILMKHFIHHDQTLISSGNAIGTLY